MEREKERKRPCLRLNYPPDGKCNDCVKGSCRYDKICFMCGQEGHGAFQSFSSGKMRGEMKCQKHRTFLSQMAAIREQYGLNEEDVMEIFQPKVVATSVPSTTITSPTTSVTSTPSSPVVSALNPTSAPPLAQPTSSFPSIVNPSASPVSSPNVSQNPNPASVIDSNTNQAPKSPAASSLFGYGIDEVNSPGTNGNWNQSLSVSSILNGSTPNGTTNPGSNPASTNLAPPGVSQYSAWGNPTSPNPTPPPTTNTNPNMFSIGGILTASPPPKSPGLGLGLSDLGIGLGNINISGGLTSINGGGPTTVSSNNSSNIPTYEIIDNDDYSNPTTNLKLSLSSALKDSSGTGGLWYKGLISTISHRGLTDETPVAVFAWRKSSSVDERNLKQELKSLRVLATNSNSLVSKMLYRKSIDLPPSPATGKVDLSVIISEYSEYGYLDRYMSQINEGFSISDLQSFTCQLLDALLLLQDKKVSHRNISPSSILICAGNRDREKYNNTNNILLKLCDFKLTALASLSREANLDKWTAPEVEANYKILGGPGYQLISDSWSLGLVLYFIATNGQCPFDSHRQAQQAVIDISSGLLRQCLEKHGLHTRLPMLYDLIERLIRPIQTRVPLGLIRCHPFLWSIGYRKNLIIDLANISNLSARQNSPVPGTNQRSQSMENFISEMDRYSQTFIFGSEGWVVKMYRDFVPYVQPVSIKMDFWWSGWYLLIAIRNQLMYPEAMYTGLYRQQAGHSNITQNQMIVQYLRQVVDVDFPKLLILLFELGGRHGKWDFDGDEVIFKWN